MKEQFNLSKIYSLLNHYLGAPAKSLSFSENNSNLQTQYKCANELCGSHIKFKKKLEVNFNQMIYHCWVCNDSGRLDKLAKKIMSVLDYIEFEKAYVAYTNSSDYYAPHEKPSKQFLSLPDNTFRIDHSNDDIFSASIHRFLESRGFSIDDAIHHNMLYCIGGEYAGRLLFPSYDRGGDLNYYTTREPREGVLWKDIGCGVMKKDIVFCEHNLTYDKELIMVEGPFDYLRLRGLNRTALLGSTISPHYKLFKECYRNKTQLAIYLDRDAKQKAIAIASLCISFGIPCRIIHDELYSDPGATPYERVAENMHDLVRFPILMDGFDLMALKID